MVKGNEHDRIALAKEFVNWAAETPDALVVQQFWAPKGVVSTTCSHWAKEDPQFRELYHLGKEIIGTNRLNAALYNEAGKAKMDKAVYLRGLRNFDYDQRESDHTEITFEAEQKKTSDTSQDELKGKFNAFEVTRQAQAENEQRFD